jgi:thioredoxin reductase (NADPH)
MAAPTAPSLVISPIFSPAQLAEMAPFGAERRVAVGDLLFEAGDASFDLFVVLEGEVEIVRSAGSDEMPVAVFGDGAFVGELTLLTGQRRFLTARVARAGRILAIEQREFRRLMSVRPVLADMIFAALVARRDSLRSGEGASSIRIIGSRYSPEAMSLRSFAEHSSLAHKWIDLEEDEDIHRLLAMMGLGPEDTPVVITPTKVLRRPSTGALADHLGLTFQPMPGYIFDLVVVGSGPAGLAAAVYGASEGLRTVSLDSVAIGGQAGMSSRIENYAGFPNGISGGDLTARAAVQAMRLGATLNAPCGVVGLRSEGEFRVVVLKDGSEIATRAVILASGAHYRRLDIPDLRRFEGAGVFYAATDLEARMCRGRPVLVVGGGNSAGQAAVHLAQNECEVTIAIRRKDLRQSMSQYLIARIEASPAIKVLTGVEVRALSGADHLEQATIVGLTSGSRQTLACAALFSFIGALPATSWLGSEFSRDARGFILTGRQLPPAAGAQPPLSYETSIAGVFAAGDVRHGSIKRVAAAVGEGSGAVSSVHERLALEES